MAASAGPGFGEERNVHDACVDRTLLLRSTSRPTPLFNGRFRHIVLCSRSGQLSLQSGDDAHTRIYRASKEGTHFDYGPLHDELLDAFAQGLLADIAREVLS